MKKITIARLRSGVNYIKPLTCIIDSFCYLLNRFQTDHTEFRYGVYNFGWGKANRRNPEHLLDSDIIIIPSENEFHYHIPNYIDPKNLEKSNTAIKEHFPELKNKHIIMLCSDRGDTEELYREKVFKDNPIGKFSTIDECDIPGNLHQMKYHFIKDLKLDTSKKPFTFSYWGTEKRRDVGGVESGDQRHNILKDIQVGMGRYRTRFIGRFSTVKRDDKPMKMIDLSKDILSKTRYTLCFNWKDNTATTSRYHEAIACGIIPMVYKDYDSTGILVKDDWQRVESAEELDDKIHEVNYESKFKEVNYSHSQSLLTKDEIYDTFSKILMDKINE
mgnify:CR=1 FL=1|tara:strand:- start:391 stop:1383 length:993 start_codon:yes stop_codon:yes gene_type:complete